MARKSVVPTASGLKYCPRCGVVKDVEEFSVQSKKPDGRSTYCIPCRLEYEKEYRVKRKERQEKLKDEVLVMYGSSCSYCGYSGSSSNLMLRDEEGKIIRDFKKVRKEGAPSKYKVICRNCYADSKAPS